MLIVPDKHFSATVACASGAASSATATGSSRTPPPSGLDEGASLLEEFRTAISAFVPTHLAIGAAGNRGSFRVP